MADCAAESGVFSGFPIRTIPYEVPKDPWQQQNRQSARESLGLPADAEIVLFGADTISTPRKGGDLLLAALREHKEASPAFPGNLLLLSFGRGVISGLENLQIPYRALGMISDQGHLASLYAAADVFVAPSREDNLPNVVLESLASGTPVVAFRIGGMPDMIEDGRTGKLAEPFSPASLRDAISEVLSWREDRTLACRESVSVRFSPHQQGSAVLGLYEELLS
jgi:glycosyltransferase involved in cell wall biosynthesis